MALLAFENLTFSYPGSPHAALRDVNLTVERGGYVALAGLSGCGKTTLLRHARSALAPAGRGEGRVLLDGRPLASVPAREQVRRIGFVMQDPAAQIVCDRVEAELAFALESLGTPREEMRLAVAEMASFFGIQPWLHRDTDTLSGGQQQLLNLAAVLALGPDVLVLDEPTSQLDPIAAADLLAAVRRANRDLGVTVIMAEHRLEAVLADADRLVVMDGGRVVADGDPRMVGAGLIAAGSPLALALPAALRVQAAVEGQTAERVAEGGRPERILQGGDSGGRGSEGGWPQGRTSEAARAPLTVREGRRWLRARYGDGELPAAAADGTAAAPAAADAQAVADGGASDAPAAAGAYATAAGLGASAADGAVALRLRDLWFRYDREGTDVLRGLTLDVPAGAVTALVGGNGGGKSTVLKAACGLLRPYRGSVEVLGRRSRRHGGSPGEVALLPQDPTLLFSRPTVREELEEMGEAAPAVDEVAAQCQIEGLLNAHPLDVSGGERQRVALAKLLLARPRLLLLDEPSKGVDAAFKETLGALLADLAHGGTTVLVASHDLDFCARWANQVALVFDGAVTAAAPPRELFSRASFYTTAASRMARDVFPTAVTVADVVAACEERSPR